MPAVRGLLRPRDPHPDRARGQLGHLDPRQRRRPLQPRLPLPQGRRAEGPARGPRPPAPADASPRRPRRLRARQLGRGLRRGRPPAAAAARAVRRRRGRADHRQPGLAQDRLVQLLPAPGARAGHAQPVLGLDAGPDAQATRLRIDVRPLAQRASAGPAAHRPLHLPGRQPHGQQRQPVDQPRLPRQGQGDARARRAHRRHRPAPHRDRPSRRRAPRDPSRRRRLPAAGAAAHRVRRRPGTARSPGSACRGPGRAARRRRRLPARARRRALRHLRRDPAAPRARIRDHAQGGALRPLRHLHAALRLAEQLAHRRAQHRHRPLRHRGRPDVPQGRRLRRQHAGPAGPGQGRGHRAPAQPRRQGAGGDGRIPHQLPRRGDRDPRRRPGACADHRGLQPGAVLAERRAARARARRPGFHAQPGPLHQRDQPPRRPDPAAALPAGGLALRHGLRAAFVAQPCALVGPGAAGRCRRPGRAAGRMADAAAAGGRRLRRAQPAGASRLDRRRAARRAEAPGRRPGRGRLRDARGRAGPARWLDLGLRSGPYGDGFGAKPDGLTLAKVKAAPHGIDLGELQPRVPEILRTSSGRIDLAPSALLADLAHADAALRHPTGDELLLIGRRETRSNNSWMHNLPVLAKGR
ncbi:hypothetical protein FUT87_16320, partial [Mitsuaria sp. TWR114]